jgi:hypothetical protein
VAVPPTKFATKNIPIIDMIIMVYDMANGELKLTFEREPPICTLSTTIAMKVKKKNISDVK